MLPNSFPPFKIVNINFGNVCPIVAILSVVIADNEDFGSNGVVPP